MLFCLFRYVLSYSVSSSVLYVCMSLFVQFGISLFMQLCISLFRPRALFSSPLPLFLYCVISQRRQFCMRVSLYIDFVVSLVMYFFLQLLISLFVSAFLSFLLSPDVFVPQCVRSCCCIALCISYPSIYLFPSCFFRYCLLRSFVRSLFISFFLYVCLSVFL